MILEPERAEPPVRFVKQYGAPRTGTNLLRAVMARRFPTVEVLIHALGDKHSPPTEVARGLGVDPTRPALELVTEATLSAPAATTDLSDPGQRAYLERIAQDLVAALEAGRVRYVISIRDPYAWLSSARRWSGWLRAVGGVGSRLPPGGPEAVLVACQAFARCYRAWWELIQGPPPRGIVVPWEQLITDPGAVLGSLDVCVAGGPVDCAQRLPPFVVGPTHWDDSPTRTGSERFDPSYHLERRYLRTLDRRLRHIVTTTMDWDLLAQWGYKPLEE